MTVVDVEFGVAAQLEVGILLLNFDLIPVRNYLGGLVLWTNIRFNS